MTWDTLLHHWPLLLGVALVIGLGAARWSWSHRHGRFFTVVEGQLFRSGAIPPELLQRKVRRHGIRAVIDLRSARPEVDREREALAAVGVKHFHLPSKQIPRAETIDAVLELLDQPENRPALFHCNHGVRRAAQFEAICRMEYQRWSNERALSVLRRRSAFMGFRAGSRPHKFVQGYVPRHERAAASPAP
jgi:protein tyrosine/serine phosphatase